MHPSKALAASATGFPGSGGPPGRRTSHAQNLGGFGYRGLDQSLDGFGYRRLAQSLGGFGYRSFAGFGYIRRMSDPRPARRTLITGGSAGLGRHVAAAAICRGDWVTIVGRDPDRLSVAAADLNKVAFERGRHDLSTGATDPVQTIAADVTDPEAAGRVVQTHLQNRGGLDLLVNVVGQSDRGRIDRLTPDRLHELIDLNVVSTLNVTNAALDELRKTGGAIVNVASLAGRASPPYLGGYSIAKHALVAMTRQLRLEVAAEGVHVGLVCPGPIRRDDNERRYEIDDPRVPDSAGGPAGGAALKGLDPADVAAAVLRCGEDRITEITLPGKVRLLRVLDAIRPNLADRFLS